MTTQYNGPQDESRGDQPLVSVIVPVYNGEKVLGEALTSLMRQTWGNLEIVIIDDGSSDLSREVADLYARMDGPGRRFLVLAQENSGVAAARNRGIERSSGKYLIFLDADDAFLPGAISRLMAERERLGGGRRLVSSQGAEVTSGPIVPGRPLHREAMPKPSEQRMVSLQFNFGSLSSIFPRSFFAEVGLFNEEADHVEDWELWLRAIYSGWRFYRLDEILLLLWWSAGSLTSDVEAMGRGGDRALTNLLEKFRDSMTPDEIAFLEHRLRIGSPQRFIRRSAEDIRAGRLDSARRNLARSAELMPFQKRVRLKRRISRLPGGMELLRRRQRRLDQLVDYDPALGR